MGEQVGLSFSKGPGLAALLMIVHSRATSSYQTASLGARAGGGAGNLPSHRFCHTCLCRESASSTPA